MAPGKTTSFSIRKSLLLGRPRFGLLDDDGILSATGLGFFRPLRALRPARPEFVSEIASDKVAVAAAAKGVEEAGAAGVVEDDADGNGAAGAAGVEDNKADELPDVGRD